MINYILQVLFFQLLFLAVYDVFLKKETFFQWNRFYLITSSVLAYFIPFMKIRSVGNYLQQTYQLPEVILNPQAFFLNEVVLGSKESVASLTTIFTLENVYFLGLIVMFGLFLFKIIQIIKKIKTNKIIKKPNYKLVVLNDNHAFSFFDYIFLGKSILKKDHQHILKHELTHVKQKHSLDLLFFEIQKIVFWFNPFSYLFQHRISTLHEFIADAKTIATKDKSSFFENLLQQSFNVEKITFVNNYYKKSLLKKRIIMATKNKSKQILKMKYLLVIPLICSMLIITSCNAQIKNVTNSNEVKVPPPPPKPKSVDIPPPLPKNMEKEVLSLGTIDKTPVYPGCEKLNSEEQQKCLQKSISKHVGEHFNMKLIRGLGLKPGKRKIHVQFKINKDGNVEDIMAAEITHNKKTNKVTRKDLHPKVEKEAIRIIELLPKMEPAEKDGKKVTIRYNLPIAFVIKDKEIKK